MVEQVAKDELMVREILSTAKALFAHHGLKKTTMEDIANSLGKGKSTLYYYFTNGFQYGLNVFRKRFDVFVYRFKISFHVLSRFSQRLCRL